MTELGKNLVFYLQYWPEIDYIGRHFHECEDTNSAFRRELEQAGFEDGSSTLSESVAIRAKASSELCALFCECVQQIKKLGPCFETITRPSASAVQDCWKFRRNLKKSGVKIGVTVETRQQHAFVAWTYAKGLQHEDLLEILAQGDSGKLKKVYTRSIALGSFPVPPVGDGWCADRDVLVEQIVGAFRQIDKRVLNEIANWKSKKSDG